MKGEIMITISILLLGAFVFYLNSDSYSHSMYPHENELPPMALVNNTMYYLISDIEDEIPPKADGTLKKIVLFPRRMISIIMEMCMYIIIISHCYSN